MGSGANLGPGSGAGGNGFTEAIPSVFPIEKEATANTITTKIYARIFWELGHVLARLEID